MKILNLYPGSWGANCYLLISDGHAAVVDPSASAEVICQKLKQEGAVLDFILLTHGHFDHVISLASLREQTGTPVYIHEADMDMPNDAHKNAFYHVFAMERQYGKPDCTLKHGDRLSLGNEIIEVLHTPGHTAGCVCYLCNDQFLLTGDTLFARDRGRTDLYSSNTSQLFQSLNTLRSLPQNLTIYPGHGAPALLGEALDSIEY